jgi:hypothetical protein
LKAKFLFAVNGRAPPEKLYDWLNLNTAALPDLLIIGFVRRAKLLEKIFAFIISMEEKPFKNSWNVSNKCKKSYKKQFFFPIKLAEIIKI